MDYAIDVKGLAKYYGNIKAVDGIDLQIKKGEIFGLLGPNGAGKTTTLSMLATILRPTHGTATVAGHDVVRESGKVRQSIGMVFQDPSLDDLLTAQQNLEIHCALYSVPKSARSKRIQGALKLVELSDRKNDLIRTYSGGMRRRLEIARGLLHYPEVLFLDEPTLGLDPQTREHLWSYIEDLSAQENLTIILTTHYMEEAERLCDRIGIIDNGKLIALGSPDELRKVLGGDVVRVKVKDRKEATAKLKKLKFIKKIESLDHELMITLKDTAQNLPGLLKTLGSVESLDIHKPTLNDVFLYYTGREIREESEKSNMRLEALKIGRK